MFLWFFLPKIDDKSLLIFFLAFLKPKGVLKTISKTIKKARMDHHCRPIAQLQEIGLELSKLTA